MNTYQTTHRAACPNGDLMDTYQITIRSQATIMVEDILRTLNEAPGRIYQEDLATLLRAKLGAEVTVEGVHHGIHITSTRP
jgi:hypothetical protein